MPTANDCTLPLSYHHIETHYQSRGFEPLSLIVYHDFCSQASNVFLYSKLIVDRNRTCVHPFNGAFLPLEDYEFIGVMTSDYGWG